MKVLHVIGSLEDGGAEAVLYSLIRETPHIDHVVVPLAGRGKYVRLLENAGVEVRPLDVERGVFSILKALKRLKRLLDETQPSVIQTWMYHAAIFGILSCTRNAGVRIYMGIHNTAVERRHNRLPTYACIHSLRYLHDRFTGVIYCSNSAQQAHEGVGYPSRNAKVITNGVCTRTFRPCYDSRRKLRAAFGISGAAHLFGMVARVHPQKNHEALLHAVAELRQRTMKPFKVLLVGRGTNNTPALRKAILDSNIGEYILALGPRNDIPGLMSAIDTLVLPSAYGEAFPMVLCEAMSCGTPCIATDVGDSAAIVGNTGLVVPPGNSEALTGAMLRRLDGPPERTVHDDMARKRAIQEFSIATMAQGYERLWVDGLGERIR